MPKFLEDKLKAEAAKKGMTGKAAARYTFGAMNDMGAMKGNKETAKGAEMQDKHMAKLKGESHSYDNRRPVKQVRSRYSK